MRPMLLFGLLLLAGCGGPKPTLAHGQPISHWLEALQDPDARVRKKAAEALGNVGAVDGTVVPALAAALKDRDPAVRSAAVLALLKIGPEAREATGALAEAQHDKDPQVREYARKALAKIQREGPVSTP